MHPSRHENDEATSSETLPRWGFLVGLAFLVVGVLFYRQGSFQGRPLAYVAGSLWGGTLVLLFLAGLVSLPFAKARRFRVRVIALVVYALVFTLVSKPRPVVDTELRRELAEASEQMRRDALAQLTEGGRIDADVDEVAATIEAWRDQAGRSDDEEGRAIAALLSVNEDMLVFAAAKQDAAKALAARGTITSVTSLDDVAGFKGAIESVQGTNERLIAFLEAFDERCEAALGDVEVSDAVRRKTRVNFVAGAQVDQLILIAACDTDVLEALWLLFDLVAAEWETLSIRDETLIFEDQAALDRYNELQAVIQSNAERQLELQRRLFAGR